MTTTTKHQDAEREAQRLAEQATADLISAMENLVYTLENAIESAKQGLSVNSLGVCQGRALDVDRLCALRQERYQMLKMLQWANEPCNGFVASTQGAPRVCARCGQEHAA